MTPLQHTSQKFTKQRPNETFHLIGEERLSPPGELFVERIAIYVAFKKMFLAFNHAVAETLLLSS